MKYLYLQSLKRVFNLSWFDFFMDTMPFSFNFKSLVPFDVWRTKMSMIEEFTVNSLIKLEPRNYCLLYKYTFVFAITISKISLQNSIIYKDNIWIVAYGMSSVCMWLFHHCRYTHCNHPWIFHHHYGILRCTSTAYLKFAVVTGNVIWR